MANPKAMIRSDGTRVIPPRHPSWKTEFYGLWITLITDPWIVLLFPMFFASNWFYTWPPGRRGATENVDEACVGCSVSVWLFRLRGGLSKEKAGLDASNGEAGTERELVQAMWKLLS